MIPFDVARVIVLGIPHGRPIEEAEEKFGFKTEVIEQFFRDEIEYSYNEFQKAHGLSFTCFAPYYDLILPIRVTHDIRSLAIGVMDSYGNMPADTEITSNDNGVWLNEDRMNIAAYHSFDASNELGVIFIAVSGVYRDTNGEFREFDVHTAVRVTDDNYHFIMPVPYPSVGEIEEKTVEQFETLFKCIRNDYRLEQESEIDPDYRDSEFTR